MLISLWDPIDSDQKIIINISNLRKVILKRKYRTTNMFNVWRTFDILLID